MPYWGQMTCNAGGINEKVYYCPIDVGQVRFFSPRFSTDAQPVRFLAVYDGYAGEDDPYAYELILGNHEGAGAFTFPDPKLLLPFHRVADTKQNVVRTDVRPAVAGRAYHFAIGLIDSSEVSGEKLVEAQVCNEWLEKMRRIRPYHGFYGGRMTHEAVRSTDADIMGLKDMTTHFSEPLTDSSLPERFRDGVSYVLGKDVVTICRKFDIPLTNP